MKVAIAAAIIAQVVYAQDYSNFPQVPHTASINGFADPIYSKLPACAQPCVKQSTGNTPCPYWDAGCLCVMPQFGGLIGDCIAQNCDGADVQSATALAQGLCSSVGAGNWNIPASVSTELAEAATKAASTTAAAEATSSSSAVAAASATPSAPAAASSTPAGDNTPSSTAAAGQSSPVSAPASAAATSSEGAAASSVASSAAVTSAQSSSVAQVTASSSAAAANSTATGNSTTSSSVSQIQEGNAMSNKASIIGAFAVVAAALLY